MSSRFQVSATAISDRGRRRAVAEAAADIPPSYRYATRQDPRRREVECAFERCGRSPLAPGFERVIAALDELERRPVETMDQGTHLVGRPERIARAVQQENRRTDRRQVSVAALLG